MKLATFLNSRGFKKKLLIDHPKFMISTQFLETRFYK